MGDILRANLPIGDSIPPYDSDATNMTFVAIIAFLVATYIALQSPSFALALVISMFAVKQLVQAGNPWLMQPTVWTTTSATVGVIRASKPDPARRNAAAMLVAWNAYEMLLVNKEGALWGVTSMFPVAAIMARLLARDSNVELAETPAKDWKPAVPG